MSALLVVVAVVDNAVRAWSPRPDARPEQEIVHGT